MNAHIKTLLIALLLICQPAFSAPEQVYLFRHSEKQTGENPFLTAQGQARAEHLVSLVNTYPNITLFSSNYNRTLNTAAPLAAYYNIIVITYDAADLMTLKKQLLAQNGVVVVIGHSNTTPQLASLLSNQAIESMDESQYGHYYLVSKLENNSYEVKTLTMGF